jgi:hypothetical protein
VFVAVNGSLGLLVALRPRWALWPTLVLATQQGMSHGTDLVESLGPGRSLDVASLVVLFFFAVLIALLAVVQSRGNEDQSR